MRLNLSCAALAPAIASPALAGRGTDDTSFRHDCSFDSGVGAFTIDYVPRRNSASYRFGEGPSIPAALLADPTRAAQRRTVAAALPDGRVIVTTIDTSSGEAVHAEHRPPPSLAGPGARGRCVVR
jgi:hypothetical protein